jgi:hypothetical protein
MRLDVKIRGLSFGLISYRSTTDRPGMTHSVLGTFEH